MLDQSFSAKSFREIFDVENRKGNNLEDRFRKDFSKSQEMLRKIKEMRRKLKKESSNEQKAVIKEEIKELQDNRRNEIQKVLELQEERIKDHEIILEKGGDFGGQCYKFEEKLLNFLISKKIQFNINRNYKIKQASRHSILSSFINLVEDQFPKYIVRTDIRNFYESMPQKALVDKIEEDHLLSITSLKYIKEIFREYNRLTGQSDKNAIGLPRGVGISAYLSELFMRDIDSQIRNLDDLVYYARYVDDIVAVFIPISVKVEKSQLEKYYLKIKDIVIESGIKLNQNKTKCFNLLNNDSQLIIREEIYKDDEEMISTELRGNKGIEFLGYEIGFLNDVKIKTVQKIKNNEIVVSEEKKKTKKLSVQLSKKRLEKYLERINSAFLHFEKKKHHNRKYAFNLLKARLEYLTSNTKLKNNKDRVFVGVYYSNIFLTDNYSLRKLNEGLNRNVSRSKLNQSEKKQLRKYSFITGFENKTFQVLPLKNKVYKNHNNRSQDKNKGVLRFGISEINSIWRDEKQKETYKL